MIAPPIWTPDELETERREGIAIFRKIRLEEPLEAYLEFFDQYQGVFENLLEMTVDLTDLYPHGLRLLTEGNLVEAVRYLAGPPISTDDLKTISETSSLNKKALAGDPELVRRVIDLVLIALDRRRFPWVTENREPSEAERLAAIVASTSLLATTRLGTSRRNKGKKSKNNASTIRCLRRISDGCRRVQTKFCLKRRASENSVSRASSERARPISCSVSGISE